MSRFLNKTCKILGVKHVTTTAYHPQANGTAERFHQTLNSGPSYYVNVSGTNLDTLLPFYLMAYNGSPHVSTGFTPHYLLHGKEIVLPTTHGHRAELPPHIRGTELEPRLKNVRSSLRLAYTATRESIRKARANNKYYDRKATDRHISVGGVVYVYNASRKAKAPKMFGTHGTVLFG
jgi:transposase InsO family protein